MLRTLFFLIALSDACFTAAQLTPFVNPFIGTDAHGHTHPAATLPFGMVQLGPDTRRSMLDWDGCSGYHYTDRKLYGFSHTHLSGTGVPDYGDVLLLPFTGTTEWEPEKYAASFDKSTEKAAPGYYSVRLSGSNILCEMTATERVGVHRYTFSPETSSGHLLLDLRHRDEVLESAIQLTGTQEITGYRISKSWAERQHLYFVIRFSQPVTATTLMNFEKKLPKKASAATGTALAADVTFDVEKHRPLIVTVGISAVSIEGARRNLAAECPHFQFEQTRKEATRIWEKTLSAIEIAGATPAQQRTFYTALYHTVMAPNLWSDTDGQYRGMDQQIHQANHNVYTVFSLWDTYRAANPLHALIAPDRLRDFVRTFMLHYEQGGLLPVWELAANETNCMIGNHAIPVIFDAYKKGLTDTNQEAALLQAMVKSADLERLGLGAYRRKGYIPANEEPESVSKTLEYAFDDWCISEMAAAQGKTDLARRFARRATQYRNLYDPQTGFFRARENGTWRIPFDPREVNFNFTEANAWQYRFSPQHDIGWMMAAAGGKERFAQALDSLFNAPAQTTGRNQADITGLIGQYAHGNEPCHHVAYLFNSAGRPDKTRHYVHRIMNELYSDRPDGLCGNDDCGQMSAWYVWSALGLYPVTPGSNLYETSAPLFDKVVIHLSKNQTLTITAPDTGAVVPIWQGKPLKGTQIRHEAIADGGTLEFVAAGRQALPGRTLVPLPAEQPSVPWMAQGARVFTDSQSITLAAANTDAAIFYRWNEGPQLRYERPFEVNESGKLIFWAEKGAMKSMEEQSFFYKKSNNLKVLKYAHPYSPQYTGGGMDGLTDLLPGGADFRSGGWQGFEGVDLDVVLDLGTQRPLTRLNAHFFQDENAWIFLPLRVEYELSDDGITFSPAGSVGHDIAPTAKGIIQRDFPLSLSEKSARYVRVRGVCMGQCPASHKGAGYPGWIFADEVSVE